MLNYIKKHWKGELSLVTSFWINFSVVNLLYVFTTALLSKSPGFLHPLLVTRVSVSLMVFHLIIVYPWQFVGVWRSATRSANETGKRALPILVKIILIIGVMGTLAKWEYFSDSFSIAFGPDKFTNYEISLINEHSFLHLQGMLGWGISSDVKTLLVENKQIVGIILDSPGGRVYESRKLAELIFEFNLDTYSLKGCESACVTAFIAGENRYLAEDANLGFHNYTTGSSLIDDKVDMQHEMENDFEIYRRQGVEEIFLKTIVANTSKNMWYPTFNTMLNDGIIHGLIDPSEILPVELDTLK